MITVHARDAHPQFVPPRDDLLDQARLVIWDDPSVAIVGTVPEVRRVLTASLQLLPVDGVES